MTQQQIDPAIVTQAALGEANELVAILRNRCVMLNTEVQQARARVAELEQQLAAPGQSEQA